MKNIFIGVLILGVVLAQAQNFDSVKIVPVRVTENIYMLKGEGGNIGVLAGSDGVLLVDDQYAPLSERITEAITKINASPVKYVINTHLHGDHSGGNENFKKQGATVVAQEKVRERMSKDRVAGDRTIPAREKDAWPVVTFSDKINFYINNEEVEIIHFGYGHTDGDAIIHFKKANVFHTGDLFVRYGYPYIDLSAGGGFSGFIDNLDKILSLLDDQSKVIPGHGELATKADVKQFRDTLISIRDGVISALKKGKKLEDIPGLGITEQYDAAWGKGFQKGKDFVLLVANDIKARQTK